MSITKVEVCNYKCHKNIDVEIKQLTILAGSNASGKSSFLQSILLGMYATEKMRRLGELKKNERKKNNTVVSTMPLSERKVRTDDIYGQDLGIPTTIVSNYTNNNININVSVGQHQNEIELSMLDDNDSLEFEVSNSKVISEKLPQLFFLGAERQGPRHVSSIKNVRANYVGVYGEHTAYLIADIERRQKVEQLVLPSDLQKGGVSNFRVNCEAWLSYIIPDTGIECNIDINKRQAVMRFNNKGQDFCSPPDTGFGITYLIPIIAQALAASLIEKSILIVENPEAHLHPYSQSMLGRFLATVAKTGVQVITETHSDHIIDGCRIQALELQSCESVKILFFEKENGESKCQEISLNSKGELEYWPKGFFDQMKNDLRTLLEMRRRE